ARQHRALVLLVPPDDHAGHAVHRAHGAGHVPELARPPRIDALAALGVDAGVSLPVHREHTRLDDGGARAAAVADLWPVPHARRGKSGGEQRRHRVHVDRLHRAVFRARAALPLSGRARDRPRSGRRSDRPMIALWYGIVSFMLIGYVTLDGR